jgi:hypothetical protein
VLHVTCPLTGHIDKQNHSDKHVLMLDVNTSIIAGGPAILEICNAFIRDYKKFLRPVTLRLHLSMDLPFYTCQRNGRYAIKLSFKSWFCVT